MHVAEPVASSVVPAIAAARHARFHTFLEGLMDEPEHQSLRNCDRWVIALLLSSHLHSTCPLICIRLDQSFASDLTSTLGGPDWERSPISLPRLRLAEFAVCAWRGGHTERSNKVREPGYLVQTRLSTFRIG